MTARTLLVATGIVALFTVGGCEGTPTSPLQVGAALGTQTSSPRSGALHIAKECSEYGGAIGDHCTIVSSNIAEIPTGSRVYYLARLKTDNPSGLITYDGDVRLDVPGSNVAFGHCVLSDFAHAIGTCAFSGGTGRFQEFSATAAVSADADDAFVAHWDGSYSFGLRGVIKN
jgi:hypothetical protein